MNRQKTRATLRVLWYSFILQTKDKSVAQTFLFSLLFQPIIFSLISVGTYVYGHKPDFALFAIIGAGLIGVWNSNLWTSSDIIRSERRYGNLFLLLATPTPLPLILAGKSFANALISVFAIAITFATGAIAFQVPIHIADPVAFTFGVLLLVISIACLGLVLGSLFILTRRAGEFVQVANFPVYILSGLSIPLNFLPLWTRPLSAILPPTWGNILLYQAAQRSGETVLPYFIWLLSLSLLYLFIARILYKRVEVLALREGALEQW